MTSKSKWILSLLAAVVTAFLLLPGAVSAADPVTLNGDGTVGSPYEITSASDLAQVKNDLTAHYKLTADIDLSGVAWSPIGVLTYDDVDMNTGGMGMSKVFTGVFDGNGKTISNINVETDGSLFVVGGLFACSTGVIKDLTVKNVVVIGDENTMSAGGIVGYAMSGEVSNVDLTADVDKRNSVTGINCVGGVVGGSMADIHDCDVEKTDITVIGDNDFSDGRIIQCDVAEVGGPLVGGAFTGSVKNCTAADSTVTATGNEPVGLGGLAGCLQCISEISGNEVTNVIITTTKGGHAIGGLTGYAGMGDDGSANTGARIVADPAEITNCTVAGITISAPGATHVGGLVGTGLYYYGMEDRFNVTDCSVSGSINAGTGADSVYGFTVPGAVAGRATGSDVDGCYFSGLTINGDPATDAVGVTGNMYESADQYDDDVSGALLYALTDTYQELFEGAMFEERYDAYWHDYCATILGAETAGFYADMLKYSMSGTPASVGKEDSETFQFYCGFYDDEGNDADSVATFTFNGSVISGHNANGGLVFSHPYRYIGADALYYMGYPMGEFSLFESLDNNTDQFKYFLMAPDTPAGTYHIEFRYGDNLEELRQSDTGKYAFWLAAGIPTRALEDPEETMMEQVIALFVTENMDYDHSKEGNARTAESLLQIADLIGIWDADMTPFKDAEGMQNAKIYCVLRADGVGETYVAVDGTSFVKMETYQFYAYDNDNDANTKTGVYVAYDPSEGESESAYYSIASAGGETVITFSTLSGEGISYVKRVAVVNTDGGGLGGGGSPVATKTEEEKQTQTTTPAASAEPVAALRDVSTSDWYYEDVKFAVENGLFKGVSESEFAPDAQMTRAMLATVLHRLAGEPAAAGAAPFGDVPAGRWFTEAVAWASANGVIDGYSADVFGANDAVTREQIAVLLYRYAKLMGYDVSATADLSGYADVGAVAEWAREAMAWANATGLIAGRGANALAPADTATRAEVAAMLHRFASATQAAR